MTGLGRHADRFHRPKEPPRQTGAIIHVKNTSHCHKPLVVRFGEKYKQWNAAFDAGYAAALGKALIILHAKDVSHALKEVDAAALAVAETPEQVINILKYVQNGELPL